MNVLYSSINGLIDPNLTSVMSSANKPRNASKIEQIDIERINNKQVNQNIKQKT